VAGLTISQEARGQFAAVAHMRWQVFVNSLRSAGGRMELVSGTVIGLVFAVAGIGGAWGLGAAAKFLVSHNQAEWLALLLWPVFMFWQLFPVLATAFTTNFDSSNLLRFPLDYSTFFLIRIVYGSLEPATALGCLWLAGVAVGIGFAAPHFLLWALLVLLVFAILNILIGRMVFAWIERWLARRRTREILGIVFFVVIIGFQFIGPLVNHFGQGARTGVEQLVTQWLPIERVLPPGLAASAIAGAMRDEFPFALGALLLLLGYGNAALFLLNLRLRAQYHGENLSEGTARVPSASEKSPVQSGWSLPGIAAPVTAIFEKEFRYLSRSGPMLFTLIMPVVILLLFRLTPSRSGDAQSLLVRAPDLAFPLGAAYSLLILTNLVYNNFGADGAGVQFYFVWPVRFRQILLAKNLAHACVLALETILVWLAVCLVFRPPSAGVTLATLAGLSFALLVNLSVGNLLSILAPKKIDFGTFGRQKASNLTVFASFGVQIAIFGLGAIVFLWARSHGELWLEAFFFLVLAAFAVAAYALGLNRADRLALGRREALLAELSRA